MDKVEDTLNERGDRYGDFKDNADISIGIMNIMQRSPNWDKLPSFMKKSLITIADKISRILTGDPHYTDNWHDIQGYAKLAEDRCDTSDPNQSELPFSVRLRLADRTIITNLTNDDVEWLGGFEMARLRYGRVTFEYKDDGWYHEIEQTTVIPRVS